MTGTREEEAGQDDGSASEADLESGHALYHGREGSIVQGLRILFWAPCVRTMPYSYNRTASDAATTIERIQKDLFQKNYTTALEKGARLVKDSNLVKRAEALHTLYNLQVGARSRNLDKYVGELADEVLAKAERVLDPEDYDQLKQAFSQMPL